MSNYVSLHFWRHKKAGSISVAGVSTHCSGTKSWSTWIHVPEMLHVLDTCIYMPTLTCQFTLQMLKSTIEEHAFFGEISESTNRKTSPTYKSIKFRSVRNGALRNRDWFGVFCDPRAGRASKGSSRDGDPLFWRGWAGTKCGWDGGTFGKSVVCDVVWPFFPGKWYGNGMKWKNVAKPMPWTIPKITRSIFPV